MESWSWPPQYDDGYFPPSGSRYWFPRRETMDPAEREQAILQRLREVMQYAYERAPFYREKWRAAGVVPADVRTLADFEQVPVVTKSELREAQARCEPFGDYLCVEDSEVMRVHGTSGTTGRPTAFAISRHDWRTIGNNHARIMWAMGLRPGDMVMIAAVFSLYMGSWGALAGSERLHCKSFPFGAGAAGMSARCAHWLALTKPAAFYGTPSYALYLAEVAREEGLDPRGFGLRIMFFSGEPGASVPATRERIEETYGARVIDCGTMGEMTPWMSAAGSRETRGMMLWQDIVYHEVCDPESYRRVPYGSRGTLVYTHLERTSQPMIRLASGDVSHWVEGPSACGRTYPVLPDGIYGRVDDMITVRGENVFPAAVDAVLNRIDGYGGEHRIIVSREAAMDELIVRVEAAQSISRDDWPGLESRVQAAVTRELGVRVKAEVVAPGTYPRTDFKARRVIDDRRLFDHLASRKQG